MPYKIAIASGKGGTGKTTLSVNLFHSLKEKNKDNILLVDCDVEEPNDALFFSGNKITHTISVEQLIPAIENKKCTYCRQCVNYCEFNAIVIIPPVQFAEVNPNLCHSCGACTVACQYHAITETPSPIGEIACYEINSKAGILEGRLKIGSAMQTMLIKELKNQINQQAEIIIYDAPPGTSCSVVETICDANYVILAAEPTRFGLHDLKLMIELIEQLELPFGVVINKAGLGNNDIYHYLEKKQIEIIGEIPFNEAYASNYALGNLVNNQPKEISDAIDNIVHSLESKLMIHEGNNYFKW